VRLLSFPHSHVGHGPLVLALGLADQERQVFGGDQVEVRGQDAFHGVDGVHFFAFRIHVSAQPSVLQVEWSNSVSNQKQCSRLAERLTALSVCYEDKPQN